MGFGECLLRLYTLFWTVHLLEFSDGLQLVSIVLYERGLKLGFGLGLWVEIFMKNFPCSGSMFFLGVVLTFISDKFSLSF